MGVRRLYRRRLWGAFPLVAGSKTMRVLYLAHNGAWPTVDGGRRRDAELLPRLWDKASIDYVAVSQAYDRDTRGLSDRAPAVNRWRVFRDESSPKPVPARVSGAARDLLAKSWSDFDTIHVEGHYLLDLLPRSAWPRVVLVEHNVESELLRQRSQVGQAIQPAEIDRVRRREQSAWRGVGQLVMLTEDDAALVASRTERRPAVITNGWDHLDGRRAVRSDQRQPEPQVSFVGNYEYAPNRDAIAWLLDEIFPKVRMRVPGVHLRLIGNAVPQDLGSEGVAAIGWTDDLIQEYWRADVVVVPLRIGGGVKVKVTEALQQGCCVVTTPIGAQGIPGLFREQLAIGKTADELADLIATAIGRTSHARPPAGALPAGPTWDSAAEKLLTHWQRVGGRMSSVQREN